MWGIATLTEQFSACQNYLQLEPVEPQACRIRDLWTEIGCMTAELAGVLGWHSIVS